MMDLKVLEMGKEVRVTSVELVELVNEFRKMEEEINGQSRAELKHKSFMAKIKEELEVLTSLKISQQNILPSDYKNDRGKKYPCYSLNRDGALQMLNSESAIVRYKTTEHINKLEDRVIELKEDNKDLHAIAVSDEDKAIRQYEADRVKYALRNVTQILEDSTYATIETGVDKIIEVHSNLKAKDRYKSDREMNGTEYKNKVKKYVSVRLEKVLADTRDTLKITVGTQVNVNLQKGMLETTNRSTGRLLANRDNKLERLEDELQNSIQPYRESEFCVVDCHGFSNNYMYDYSMGRVHKSLAYSRWIQNFPYIEVADLDYWEVNWNEPIEMIIHYTCKDSADVHNLDKATIDMIISRVYGFDDRIVKSVKSQQVASCRNYEDGKIGFFIRNI